MKKIFTILAVVAAVSVANAQLASDNFNYVGLLTSHGWTNHSGTALQLTSNGSAASLIGGNTEDVNKAFTAPVTVLPASVTLQYTAKINFVDGTSLTSFGDYFLCFGETSGTTITVLLARLFVKSSATGYTLGILNTSGGTAAATYGTEVAYNTPSNITVTYNASTNTATLKIDSQPLLTNSSGTNPAPTSIASICIREGGNATNGTGNALIDDLVVTNLTLGVSDLALSKNNLVKNTNVTSNLVFGAKSDIQIVNANGQVVKTATVNENTSLNVSSLTKGIYIVTGVVNGQKVSQKFMKN